MINKLMNDLIHTHLQTLGEVADPDALEAYLLLVSKGIAQGCYIERHHILPKALFPDLKNEGWNIISLTAEDHFLAHYYLYLMFPNQPKIVYALWGMCNQIGPRHQRDYLKENHPMLSKIYAEIRSAHAENVRSRQLTKNPMKGKTGSSSPFYGKKRPKEVVDKMKKNHWSVWRKPWNHNKARKDAWLLANEAYLLWKEHNCGYVRLDTLLNKPDQTFVTIHRHFKEGWNPLTDQEFQTWLKENSL